jgi:hypothetical protein
VIIEDVEQNTAEWLQLKRGCASSSRGEDMLKKRKDGQEPEGRRKYKYELWWERVNTLGDNYRHVMTQEMREGHERQVLATAEYELATGNTVTPIGFAFHPEIPNFGASTDGLVDPDGCVEIKCLQGINHLTILDTQVIPDEYLYQMNLELSCTERQWCDFVAYNPTVPRHMQLFIKRLHRDDGLIRGYECDIRQFLSEVDELVRRWTI